MITRLRTAFVVGVLMLVAASFTTGTTLFTSNVSDIEAPQFLYETVEGDNVNGGGG